MVIQLFLDHRSSCLEEEELNLFIDVDCVHTEAIMTPMPEGLSQQQVAGFWKSDLLPLFFFCPVPSPSTTHFPSALHQWFPGVLLFKHVGINIKQQVEI